MSYTQFKRKELAHAFKCALRHLANSNVDFRIGKNIRICACLSQAYLANEISYTTKMRAQDIVMERLGVYCYYDSWIEQQVGSVAYDADQNKNQGKKLQRGRAAWLKSLIKEFSS